MCAAILLQVNPPANKWILSWSLDSYDQDRKVLNMDADFLLNPIKLMNEREGERYVPYYNICPCKVLAEL